MASGREGFVNGDYLRPLAYSPWDEYFSLGWAPGCDPQRPEVALLDPDEGSCDAALSPTVWIG